MTHWAHRQIAQANCHGTLALGEVSLNTPAWAVLNVETLWEPAPVRRENISIPFRRGKLGVPGIMDDRSDTLMLLIVGTCDQNGDPTDDPYSGLEANVDWLNTNLFNYATVVDSFEATLTMPSGATKGGPLQLGTVKFGWEVGIAVTATVDFTLPNGCLDPIP